MNFRLTLIVLLSCFVFACGDDDNDNMQTEVEGEWIWQSSTGGIGGVTLTPDTENYTQKVEFEANDFKQYRADTTFMESSFEIELGETIFSVDSANIIMYSNSNLFPQSFEIFGVTLRLFDEVFDGFNHVYTKE